MRFAVVDAGENLHAVERRGDLRNVAVSAPGHGHRTGRAGRYLHCRVSPVPEIYDKLEEILLPLKKSFSRQEKRLLLKNGGKIDFWVTNDNKLAGRGREYEIILIDEAAFTKSPEMLRRSGRSRLSQRC